jgi:hypothetical protein
MTLVVENKDVTQNFILYLKKKMLSYIAYILDIKKLQAYDEYFSSDDFKKTSNNTLVSSKKVIVLGMSNLIHKRYETTTHIFINPNLTYPGTNLKVVDLCKIINYGTLSIDAYPIFTMTFDHFNNNIGEYTDRCIRGL